MSKRSHKGSYYHKLLMMFVVVACIPGLIIAASLHWLAGDQIKDHLHRLHQNQIKHRAEHLDNLLSYLETSLVHWAFEPRFGERLRTFDFVYHFEQTEELNRTLLTMQGSHPLIRQVRLFIDREVPILFDPEYNLLQDEEEITRYRTLLSHSENVFWDVFSPDEDQPHHFHFVHKIPGTNVGNEAFGAIITELDRTELANMLSTMRPYNNGITFLMDAEADVILSNSSIPLQDDMLEHLQSSVLSAEQEDEGSLMVPWEAEEFSVSYGKLNRLDDHWIYVSAVPINNIIFPVLFMSRLIFIISLAGLMFAGLLSWLMLNRVYSPVQQLLQSFRIGGKAPEKRMDEFKWIEKQWKHMTREKQSLQERLRHQMDLLKEGFLLQLLQGHLHFLSNEELHQRMKNYGWDFTEKQFIVMHVRINDAGKAQRFQEGDEGLASFAVKKVMKDLFKSEHLQLEMISFHDMTIGALISGTSLPQHKKEIYQYIENAFRKIDQTFQFKLTVTISAVTNKLSDIAALYEQARQATGYRSLDDGSQWFDLETINPFGDSGKPVYPFMHEREILQAVRLNDQAGAKEALRRFFAYLCSEADKEMVVQQGALQLLGSLQHMMLHAQVDPQQLFDGVNMYEKLSQLREPEAMEQFIMSQIIVPYVEELEKRSNLQMKRIVNKMIAHIETHYMEDLSLDQFADEEGIPAYALSKVFKQETSTNFIDYLTQVRLEHAKKLLIETDLKMNDIAKRVGYRQSYFNRIFKKHEGITPTQFRSYAAESNAVKS